jgi:hypothetical protein
MFCLGREERYRGVENLAPLSSDGEKKYDKRRDLTFARER